MQGGKRQAGPGNENTAGDVLSSYVPMHLKSTNLRHMACVILSVRAEINNIKIMS